MKPPFTSCGTSRTCLLFSLGFFLCMVWSGSAASNDVVISVDARGFGGASAKDIEKVLRSVAREMLACFPGRQLRPILVEYTDAGSPITKYKPGPKGETVVALNAHETYWAQYAYQFAHELTHILANYERTAVGVNANQWFEESVCETASLFVLSRMAASWKTDPPYPNWRSFAPKLQDYVDKLKTEPHRQLPAGLTLAAWYKSHAAELRRNGVDRKMNALVAAQLLQLLEEKPENWAAFAFLNLGTMEKEESFQKYLARWNQAAPKHLRDFVGQVAELFETKISPGE